MGLILMPILIAYVVAIIAITIFIVAKQKRLIRKIILSVLIPLVFLIGPFVDQLIGKQYFEYLCDKKSGLVVYETVSLNDYEFDKNGKLKYWKGVKDFFDFNYKDRYVSGLHLNDKEYINYGIEESSVYIKDTRSNSLIGEYRSYQFVGGVVARQISTFVSGGAIVCKKIDDNAMDDLISAIFIEGDRK